MIQATNRKYLRYIYQLLLEGKKVRQIEMCIRDRALLVTSAFLTLQKDIIVIKPNQYEANLLYQQVSLIPVSYTHLSIIKYSSCY